MTIKTTAKKPAKKTTTKLEPHQKRVVAEHRELVGKLNSLGAFMDSKAYRKLSPHEQDLLCLQFTAMAQYMSVLGMHLRVFKDQDKA